MENTEMKIAQMKLATALTERSDIQRRLSELDTRLKNNAKIQEGEAPSEDPKALLEEADRLISRLEELVSRINLTNSTTYSDGVSMTELLSKRDCLKQRITLLSGLRDHASSKIDRYSRTEIKIVSTVDVAELQTKIDALSKELRITDEKIQELNWTTELK